MSNSKLCKCTFTFVCVCGSNGLHTYTHFVMRLTKTGDRKHSKTYSKSSLDGPTLVTWKSKHHTIPSGNQGRGLPSWTRLYGDALQRRCLPDEMSLRKFGAGFDAFPPQWRWMEVIWGDIPFQETTNKLIRRGNHIMCGCKLRNCWKQQHNI